MLKNSTLPAAFERLARVPGKRPVESGSPVGVMLTLSGSIRSAQAIPAILALQHRGMNLLRAKRTIEAVMTGGAAHALLPKVESVDALTADLARAGFALTVVQREPINVAELRTRLGVTQEEFAVRYGLELNAVRNWEHGRRKPDTAAHSYLRAISTAPETVEKALWGTLPEGRS